MKIDALRGSLFADFGRVASCFSKDKPVLIETWGMKSGRTGSIPGGCSRGSIGKG